MGYPSKVGQYRDGLYRRSVVEISTASSAYEVSVDQSGTFFHVPVASTLTITLPRSSSKWLGLEYSFFLEGQAAANDVKINCALDSSAAINMAFSSVVALHSTAICNSTFPTGLRVTAVSSIVWVGEALTGMSGYFGSTATDNTIGGWSTG